jgi:integrase
MVLPMSRPFKHPKTHVYYFRKAVPADLRALVGKVEVKRSLHTKVAAEARLKFAEVEAEVERRFATLRAESRSLTRREANYLAGTLYRDFADTLDDNPFSAETWRGAAEANAMAEAGRFGDAGLMIGSPQELRRWSLEERFGAFADAVLMREGLIVEAQSRALLIDEISRAMTDAALKLAKNAGGDYRPDENAERFATKPAPAAPKAPAQTVSLPALFDRWAAETKPREKTVYAWRRVIAQLATHLGHDDTAKVTKADMVAWKDAMVASGLAAKTVRDSKLAPVLAVLRWSVANNLLPSNPAEGVGLTVRADGNKPRGYHDHEALRVLKASMCELAPVLRWLPLMCAMTGARLSELCQLRVQDIRQEDAVWFFNLTWDAGNLKNQSSERRVPLHSALIARGFLAFVKERRDGPLCGELPPDRLGNRGGTATKRIGKWVKACVGLDDPRISPSHSWRHRFKTLCRRHGIGVDFHDALTGHAKANEGATYGEFPLDALARELEKLPDPLG